jgi:hypothetical protein
LVTGDATGVEVDELDGVDDDMTGSDEITDDAEDELDTSDETDDDSIGVEIEVTELDIADEIDGLVVEQATKQNKTAKIQNRHLQPLNTKNTPFLFNCERTKNFILNHRFR